MARNRAMPPGTCVLEGCEVPVVQRPGGGRPRLYCSDAHRAEARRRRLGSARTVFGGQAPCPAADGDLEAVRALLDQALAGLERAQEAAPRDEVRVAAIRAEATAEVLRAQQAAADAARRAAAAHDRLARERGEWRAAVEELTRERDEQARAAGELSGALDGARAELEQELLRHHGDAERAESVLQAQRAAHAADMRQVTAELDDLRQQLAGAHGAAAQAEHRAVHADEVLAQRTEAIVDLEVRVARAEEQSCQATVRFEEARDELARLRDELAGERRHHRSVEAELRRQVAQPPRAGAPRRSRRPSEPAAAARTTR